MLITPIGKSFASFQEQMSSSIKKHHTEGKLLDRGGKQLKLDITQPLWINDEFKDSDTSGNLLYNPTTLDGKTGKTKQELLSDGTQPFPGFRITFIQEDLTIPREGEGAEVGGRPALEAGKSGIDYLALTQDPESPYHKEQGLTPEDWHTLFLTTLHTTNKVIDDYENGTDSICRLIGAVTKDGYRPYAYWNRSIERAVLYGFVPGNFVSNYGVRLAVG